MFSNDPASKPDTNQGFRTVSETDHDTKPVYFGKDLEEMSFAPKYHQWILDSFAGALGKRVAEIGAGSGNFTRLLLADGQRSVTAFEPSGNMYARLQDLSRAFANLQTFNCPLEQEAGALAGTFDNVLYINVLEHIEDDAAELRHAHRILNDTGRLVIFVPALSGLYSPFDKVIGHYRRYHKQPLRELVTAAGFTVDKLFYFDVAGILPWYVNFVLLGSENIPRSVVLYDNLVVPVMKRLERLVRPPVGKNLLLVASKAGNQADLHG